MDGKTIDEIFTELTALGYQSFSLFKRSNQTQWMASKLSTKPITEGGPESVSIDALGDSPTKAAYNLFIRLKQNA